MMTMDEFKVLKNQIVEEIRHEGGQYMVTDIDLEKAGTG
jgi:hypothetical protein